MEQDVDGALPQSGGQQVAESAARLAQPGHGMSASFYRRPLPEAHVAFSSEEGRRIFREALADGTLESYFPLAEQFHTQAEPAYCGLATLVVALNALAIDPGRPWKGPWRWFSEELLDCCRPLDVVQQGGLTLDELVCLARCNGVEVEVHRAGAGTLADFRAALEATSRSAGEPVLVVNYARSALGQTGEGHFSPIGGYHRARDLALVLDVARFKYPAHWVPVEQLWQAQHPVDPGTGRPRGYLLLGRGSSLTSVLCRLTPGRRDWSQVAQAFATRWPAELLRRAPRSLDELVAAFVAAIAEPMLLVVTTDLPADEALSPDHLAQREALLGEVRSLPLFSTVAAALGRTDRGRASLAAPDGAAFRGTIDRPLAAEILTLLALAAPDEVFSSVDPALRLGSTARTSSRRRSDGCASSSRRCSTSAADRSRARAKPSSRPEDVNRPFRPWAAAVSPEVRAGLAVKHMPAAPPARSGRLRPACSAARRTPARPARDSAPRRRPRPARAHSRSAAPRASPPRGRRRGPRRARRTPNAAD